uniref:SUEL-type lectin domain-containing protein n=1 Tax=Xiphophorus maculatus TaxID=8083 RepID=A0A3B5QYU7_XIPMA
FQQYIAPSILLHIGTVLMEKTGQKTRTADPNGEFSTSSQQLITMEPTGQQQLHTAAIYVTSATYGRTDKKTCSAGRPADQLENTECFTYAEEVVKASNYVFGDPCYGTYKYLEVEYICYGIRTVVACEGSEAQISCGKDIFVIGAIYGRSDRMTCSYGIPAEQTKNTNCATRAESVCEGRSACAVLASSAVFGDPCVGTYKYLEVLYLCESEFMV